MATKRTRSSARSTDPQTTERVSELEPGYTRHHNTRHVFDEKGERVDTRAGADRDHESESPS